MRWGITDDQIPPPVVTVTTHGSSIVPSGSYIGAQEMGTVFYSATAGYLTALRWYRGIGDTIAHAGHLWTAAGALLATVTFPASSDVGWQTVALTTPIAIAANTNYVVSYSTTGYWPYATGVFPHDNAPLHVPTGGGVYAAVAGNFPTSSGNDSFLADVEFVSVLPATPVDTLSGVDALYRVTVGSTVSITPSFTGSGTISYSCSDPTFWNPTTHTWTFTPTFTDGGTIKTLRFSATNGTSVQCTTTTVAVFRDFSAMQQYSGNPITAIISGFTQSDCPYIRSDQKIGNTYYSITQGDRGDNVWNDFNLYTSTDLKTWTPYGGNPVFSVDGQGANSYICHPAIIKIGSTWFKYFSYDKDSLSSKIGLATSTDLINWTPYSGNPVWSGHQGAWHTHPYSPCVIKIGGLIYLHCYTGGTQPSQEYVTSTDGYTFTYGGVSFPGTDPSDFDYGYQSGFDIWITQNPKGFYEEIYTANLGAGQVLCYAISADCKTWYKFQGPILPAQVGDGCLVFVGDDIYLLYGKVNGGGKIQGYLALLSPP